MERAPPYAALAAAILPSPSDTLLLRACLLDADCARESWGAWCAHVGDPKVMLETETRGLKGLLPLVDAAFRLHGLSGPAGMGIYLKAATLREDLRTRIIARILDTVLNALEHDGIRHTLLGGIVAAHTVYRVPTHRHCHAIDLLIAPAQRPAAAAALARCDFAPLAGSPTEFRHTDGLALHLRHDIVFHPHHLSADDGVSRRAAPVDLGARTAQGASATDRFIMALSRAASTHERGNLRWASDAWMTTRHVDWPLFLAETAARRLALPFAVLCRHLAEAMNATVPGDVLAALDSLARRATALDREAAFAGALTGLSAARRALSAPGVDTAARLEIARYLALPSAQCLAWSYGPSGSLGRALQRLHRPVGYAASRTRRRLAR